MLWMLLGQVQAHTLAPARVTLEETAQGWRLVQRMPRAALGVLTVSTACQGEQPTVLMAVAAVTVEQRLDCTGAPLVAVELSGIEESGSPVLLEVVSSAGRGQVLQSTDGTVPLPSPARWRDWAGRYLLAGMAHVLLGADHVLVVLGLAATAGRGLLRVLTGFTLGHSLTLVACALGWLRLPTSVTEALIALSLIALAEQIRRGRTHAWGMAVLLGLLHGLGFGSGLAGLGLPMEAMGTALVAFNVGVEVAQVAVVGVALLAARAAGQGRSARLALVVGLAALGSYWLLSALL